MLKARSFEAGFFVKDTDKPYHARSMSWAQRLKRVLNIDIT